MQHFHKAHSHSAHGHSHDNLTTEGETIGWARLYDSLIQLILGGQEGKFRAATLRLAQIQAGEKVLDVGCGTGTLALLVKQKSPSSVTVTGIDASPQMIARAQQKAQSAGLNVHFEAALVEAINAPDNSYDVVLSSLMVHHLPPSLKPKAFAEIYRVLKPRGRLLIVDFEPPKGGLKKAFLQTLLGQGMMQIDNRQVPKLLESAGFSQVEMGATGLDLATYISGKK